MKRFKLFVAWYKQLRNEKPIEGFNLAQNLIQGYSVINCCLWAWHNSRTHNLNGEYK
jgi:hypothetical protein